jgi:GNAT superfamily N-acetyltransferase
MHLRPLTVDDLAALQELLESDPGYAERVTGTPPGPGDAADLLSGRPPGLRTEQKVVLGAFDDGGLAAVVDVLRGWPDPATAHIGLLQVHAGRRRQGVARRTHDLLLDLVAGWPDVRTLRAAIVATNAAEAEPFWAAVGYRPSGPPTPYRAGPVDTEVTVWTRPVPQSQRP